ncbi:hypothetical protein D3C80_1918130 [compost metagenome]
MRRLPLTVPQVNISVRESAAPVPQSDVTGMAATAWFMKNACDTTIALNVSAKLKVLLFINLFLSKM